MQSLFYRMQHQGHNVDMGELFRAVQGDGQRRTLWDFCDVLFKVVKKMSAGTVVERSMQTLFEGRVSTWVSPGTVESAGSATKPFHHLQLAKQGCQDIYAYLDKLTAPAPAEAAVGGLGPQSARTCVLFKDLPPVLILELEKAQRSTTENAQGSVHEGYRVPQELDLDVDGRKYLAPDADAGTRNLYELHSIITHEQPTVHKALVRPTLGDAWYSFEKDSVTQVAAANVAEVISMAPCQTDISMLVYVRKSDKERVMCPVREQDVELQLRLARDIGVDEAEWREKREKEKRAKTDAESHVTVRVATNKDIRSQVGKNRYFDLVDISRVKAFHVPAEMLFDDFQDLVAAEFGVPVEQQRFWKWAQRTNKTFRVDSCHTTLGLRVRTVAATGKRRGELNLFLETATQVTCGKPLKLPPKAASDILLFLKMYDPLEEKLSYVGHVLAKGKWEVQDLWPHMCQLAGYLPIENLRVYKEVQSKPEVECMDLDQEARLVDYQLKTGDILCFQKDLPPELAATCRFPDVPSFLTHAITRCFVRFRHLARPTDDDFVLELGKTAMNDQVVSRTVLQLQTMVADGKKDGAALTAPIGGYLEPSKVRLYSHDSDRYAPCRHPMLSRWRDNLKKMLEYNGKTSDILYYELVSAPLAVPEPPKAVARSAVTVSVHDQRWIEVACFQIQLVPGATACDVLKLVRAEPECAAMGELVLTKVRNGRIYKVLLRTEVIDGVDDGYWSLHVEEITEPGESLRPGMRLLPVSHMHREEAAGSNDRHAQVTASGHPFVLAVGDDETLASIKPRLQAKLGAADDAFARWRFAIVGEDTVAMLQEEDAVASRYQDAHAGRWDTWLGILHPAEAKSNPRKRRREEEEEEEEEEKEEEEEEEEGEKEEAVVTPAEEGDEKEEENAPEQGPSRMEEQRAPAGAKRVQRPAPRVLQGLVAKQELSAHTFMESSPPCAHAAVCDLQRALSLHAEDTWQLAQGVQGVGRALWEGVMEVGTLHNALRVADEEAARLSRVCEQKEAALTAAVAAARSTPLDAGVLAAKDVAVADQLASLARLEDSYARKAELATQMAQVKRMLEAMAAMAWSAGAMSVDDRAGSVQGPEAADTREALVLAGDVIKECNERLMPAAAAARAAVDKLASCLALEQAVMAVVRDSLEKALDAGVSVIGRALTGMEGETPEEDAEQARILRAIVQQKRTQLADAVALRKGLQPTQVRMGKLERELRDVKKEKAQMVANLQIAELDDKPKVVAEIKGQLEALEGRQKDIAAALSELTSEVGQHAARLAQFYPEAAALPELASRLSKALPSSSDVSGDIIDPDWSLASFGNGVGRPLGSFRVRLVEDREGNAWVIKELGDEREVRREGTRLQALRHPLVIPLVRIFFDSGLAYLQMPYCKNGSLRAWFECIKGRTREGQPLRSQERQQVWATMKQVFEAVAFIHRKGVVHRDLKPENILLQDDGQIALCDFGVSHDVSRACQTTMATHAAGGFTTAYAAPEVITAQPSAKQWPFAQDMWSLGVMLLELLTGSIPSWNRTRARLEDAQGGPAAPDASGGASQGDPWASALRGLASTLLLVDPACRPSADEALSDPCGFLARDLTQVAVEEQRRMHALSSFLESLRRCPARVVGRAHLLKVITLDDKPQLVQQVLEAFADDGVDLRASFSVECGGIRVPLSEVLDRFFQAVVLPEAGLFEQGREGREDVILASQLQEGVAFLPRKACQEGWGQKKQHMDKLRAVGRVLAKAVLECLHVPVRFATALCCFLVGDEQLAHAMPSRCLELMAEFDPNVARQMRSVLAITHGSGQEHAMMASMLTRCAAKDDFAITDANKGAVVRQAVQLRLFADRKEELCALREGFLSLDDLMADHLKLMTGEVMVTLFFGQDYLDVDQAVNAFVFRDDAWRSARGRQASIKEWLQRFIREVSETGLRLLCLRALGGVDAFQSGHKCLVLPGGKERDLPAFEREVGCMYVPEGCPDFNAFQARMHRALRAGEYGVRTGAQQEERLAREEMDGVVGAMRGQVRAGGWYRCPNGHPYSIGECGGAMEVARCPTCGSRIGGQEHRLLDDNQNALDIDGAEEPAWN
eukprot:jgi/Mesvir1/1277/Mv16252-RA.2